MSKDFYSFSEGMDIYHVSKGREPGWYRVNSYGCNGDSVHYTDVGVYFADEEPTLEEVKRKASAQIQLRARLAARPRRFGDPE
jgi:hypothetical protein